MIKWRKKDISAIFIILFILVFSYYGINSYLEGGLVKDIFEGNNDAVISQILEFGNLSYFVFFILIVLESVFAPLPPLVMYIAGGTIFGGFIAGIIALAANIVGAAIAFKLAHYYGKEKLMPKIPTYLRKKFDKSSKKYGPLSIFILRFNPITSSDLFSYLAGFTNMDFNKFLFATGFGLSFTVFFQTYLGARIQESPIIAKLSMIIGILYFILFFIGYFLFKKKMKKINLNFYSRKKKLLKAKMDKK